MRSFRVFRIDEIDVRVHVTFPLVLILGALEWREYGFTGAAFGALLMLLLFACVLLHELGHALVAKRHGLRVPEITLLPIGGVAHIREIPREPRTELAIALAGPMVNVVLGFMLVGVLAMFRVSIGSLMGPPSVAGLLSWLMVSNLALAGFNLLPVFPLDGGRVVRALLSMKLTPWQATAVATWTGQGAAVLLTVYALFTGAFLTAAIGTFLFAAAGRERAVFRGRELQPEPLPQETAITAGDLVLKGGLVLHPDDLAPRVAPALLKTDQLAFPVMDGGRVLGLVTRSAIEGPLGPVPVITLLTPALRVHPLSPASVVLRALDAHGMTVAVVEEGGALLGLLPRTQIERLAVPLA